MTTRTPIRLEPRFFNGPRTSPALAEWVDQLLRDQARVLKTNVILAREAGELDADADLDALFDESDAKAAEAREIVLRQLIPNDDR